ncbi:hypothetical protein XavaCFBP5823_00420 [Xanthomonas axonopodis pv. vasculorum]|nr:hypothetical protein XavaCFBP5823_00420 [Xanthomonas axonopodis pv. vasculorum]
MVAGCGGARAMGDRMTDTRYLMTRPARTCSEGARTRTTLRAPFHDGRCKAIALRRLPRMGPANALPH